MQNINLITRRSLLVVFTVIVCLTFSANAQANDGIETAGDVLAYLMPVAAGGKALFEKECMDSSKRDCSGLLQFGESTIVAFGTTQVLKLSIREERPNHRDHHSFPSGHSSAAFSSAEFLRKRYGLEYGIPAYAVASFVAYSRVHAKQHYFHDVVVGSAIGIGSGYLFTKPYKGWTMQPAAESGFYGIRLSRAW